MGGTKRKADALAGETPKPKKKKQGKDGSSKKERKITHGDYEDDAQDTAEALEKSPIKPAKDVYKEEKKKKKKSKEVAAQEEEEAEAPLSKKQLKKQAQREKRQREAEEAKAAQGETADEEQQTHEEKQEMIAQIKAEGPGTVEMPVVEEPKKKKRKMDKKKEKADRAKKAADNEPATQEAEAPAAEENDEEAAGEDDGAEEERAEAAAVSGKNGRFIVFVGNLPYTASTNSVTAHFASLNPTSVRVLTERDQPTKCRGVAFVEFGRYDHMRTCLQKMHRSEFNDNASGPRKINVELTAGGGGNKSADRKAKIRAKNKKLNEERARRVKAAEVTKAEKKAKAEKNPPAAPEKKPQKVVEAPTSEDYVHPSRRARVPFGKP